MLLHLVLNTELVAVASLEEIIVSLTEETMKRGIYTAFKNAPGGPSILAPAQPTTFKTTVQKQYKAHRAAATHLHRTQRGSRAPSTDSYTMKRPGKRI